MVLGIGFLLLCRFGVGGWLGGLLLDCGFCAGLTFETSGFGVLVIV